MPDNTACRITLDGYFMGRDRSHAAELTDERRAHAEETVERVNRLLARAGIATAVNSGWRPAGINAGVPGAAPRSKHIECLAVDLDDPDGALDRWCLQHLDALSEIGLWLEHPDATPGWCHLQIRPPGSGNRVFEP